MYKIGELLRFSPFEFKNGNQPKPKFFIVLGEIDDKVMMAVLPTSKDHIPVDVEVEQGCVNVPERGVNAYVFNPNVPATTTFFFSKPTYVYGEQVDEYEYSYLEAMDSRVEHLGLIDSTIFQEMKDCLKKAPLLRRKYRRFL